MNYPEHEKLEAVKEKSQVIGEFIAWLESKEIYLATTEEGDDGIGDMYVDYTNIQDHLAEFFRIDRQKLAEEKDAMLEANR